MNTKSFIVTIILLLIVSINSYSQWLPLIQTETNVQINPRTGSTTSGTADVSCVDFSNIDAGNSLDMIFGQNVFTTDPYTYGSFKLNEGLGNFPGAPSQFNLVHYPVVYLQIRDIEFGQLRLNQKKDVAFSRYGCVQIFRNDNNVIIREDNNPYAVAGRSSSVSFGYISGNSDFFRQDLVNCVDDPLNSSFNGIFIYYNDGAGFFSNAPNGYQVSGTLNLGTQVVRTGKLRQNSKDDIVGVSGSNIRIYRNNGTNDVTINQTIDAGGTIKDLELGDVNGDGLKDIAVITSADTKVYLNLGNTFSTTPNAILPGGSGKLEFGDIDNDGRQDLVSVIYDGPIIAFRNTGNSSAYYSYTTGNYQYILVGGGGTFHRVIKDVELADVQGQGGLSLIFTTTGDADNFNNGTIIIHKRIGNPAPYPPNLYFSEVVNARAVIYFSNNNEPDFAGYNVYLSINSGPWVKQNTNLITASSYTDYNYLITGQGGGIGDPGDQLLYYVTAVDLENNESEASNTAEFWTTCLYCDNQTSSNNNSDKIEFKSSNYPNPFNPSTTIEYSIPNSSFVKLVVYNSLGQVVSTLVNEFKRNGKYIALFNAENLSSGMYFYTIEAGAFKETKKMVLLK